MKRNTLSLFAIGLTFLAGCFTEISAQYRKSPPRTTGTTAIVGATLIDCTGKPPMPDSVVVTEGNIIKAVGKKGSVTYPADAKVIDGTGKFVMPSFIDAHIHYRDWLPEMMLAYGVTAHSDMGNPTDWILAQRDAIAEGNVIGPRIFASGDQLGIRSPGSTIEQVRQTVQSHIAKGVNKIALTMLQDPEMLQLVVEEARKANIPISAWTMYPREAIALGVDAIEHSYSLGIASKYDNREMLNLIRDEQKRNPGLYEKQSFNYLMEKEPDDFIPLLVQKHGYLIPDLVFDFKFINDRWKEFEDENVALATNPNLRYIPSDDWLPQLMSYSEAGVTHDPAGIFGTLDRRSKDFERWLHGYRTEQHFLKKVVDAGGKVLAGTDAPNILLPGISLHHEMRLLVDAGFTPMQAIMAATIWPAEFLRQQKKLGTVEAGKMADLIVLKANPLDDIKNTRSIDLVMKDGEIVDRTFHPDFQNPIPRGLVSESQMNPRPTIRDISPKIAVEGDKEVTISIIGRDFRRASLAAFDGHWVPTTVINDGEIKATIPGELLKRVGTYSVTVWSPRPFGGTSPDIKFMVKYR